MKLSFKNVFATIGTVLLSHKIYKSLKMIDANNSKKIASGDGKFVLVTGASTGIGKSITEILAMHNYHVFATVRKQSDFDELEKISDNITPVVMDVVDHDSILKAKDIVNKKLNGEKLFSIVNNAGIAVGGPLELLPIEELKKQFEVNIFGLIDTTQVFFDLLNKENSKIIMMSSVAGRIGQPFLGAYSASKHALEAMSDSMRRELLMTGVDVVVVQPGSIVTPIWDKAEEEINLDPYKGTKYEKLSQNLMKVALKRGRSGAKASVVGDTVLSVLSRKKNYSRYTVSKNPIQEVYLPRLLPDRILDRILNKALGIDK